LIINTEKMGGDAAVRIIVDTARSEEIATCSLTAVDAMKRLSMEKKIRAALIENDINITLLHIEISEDGATEIRGYAYTTDERDRVLDVVKGLSEISESTVNITVMPSAGD